MPRQKREQTVFQFLCQTRYWHCSPRASSEQQPIVRVGTNSRDSTEQTHPEQTHPEQTHPEQSHPEQSHIGQSHIEQSHIGQSHIEQSHIGQSHIGQTGSSGADRPVDPVGYEIQTFDGQEDLDRRFSQLRSDADRDLKRLRVFLETGVLYNSNVSLTPISRSLAATNDESFQAIFNPELEWIAVQKGDWRFGPLGRDFFTINESQQSAFDLASFQGGAFLERDLPVDRSDWIARLDYVYSLDLLDGTRLGDRHAVTASMIMIRPDLDVIYTYLTTSFSEFDDDGSDDHVARWSGDLHWHRSLLSD